MLVIVLPGLFWVSVRSELIMFMDMSRLVGWPSSSGCSCEKASALCMTSLRHNRWRKKRFVFFYISVASTTTCVG